MFDKTSDMDVKNRTTNKKICKYNIIQIASLTIFIEFEYRSLSQIKL